MRVDQSVAVVSRELVGSAKRGRGRGPVFAVGDPDVGAEVTGTGAERGRGPGAGGVEHVFQAHGPLHPLEAVQIDLVAELPDFVVLLLWGQLRSGKAEKKGSIFNS